MARDTEEKMDSTLERRRERRHAVERPCRVTTNALVPEGVSGVTMDISRAGMLIKFPATGISGLLPKVGTDARVVIDLPPSANYAPRALECMGRVVRDASSSDDAPVLALQIQQMQVRERELPPSPKTPGRKRLVQ